jgi:hypothetical protein
MKLFSLLFAALVGTAVLTPVTASANPYGGERTRVSYDRCGNPVFWVYTFVGRDCHGCPIYRWVVQSCGPGRGEYNRPDYGHGNDYGRGGYGHGGYGQGGSCDRGGRISFYWGR